MSWAKSKSMVLAALVLVAAAGCVLALERPALAQAKQNYAFGGSAPGGVMYYMVGIAGTVISRELPRYNITQVSTGGSTENAKRIIKGELDFGIVYGAHVYMAQKLEGPFKGGAKGAMMRGVAKLYAGPTYFVTRPDTGLKSHQDLIGKTVALGPPGSGTVFNCSNILKAIGLLDKIKSRMMTFGDAGRAMANNQIHAFGQSSAPAASVKELAETHGAYVIPFTKEEMDKITAMFPFYVSKTMKAGTYKGVPAVDLPTLNVYWVAHERVPDKAVQDILELVYQPKYKAELVQGNKSWEEMEPDVEGFLKLGAPMHPGAVAYYKSKGLWPKDK